MQRAAASFSVYDGQHFCLFDIVLSVLVVLYVLFHKVFIFRHDFHKMSRKQFYLYTFTVKLHPFCFRFKHVVICAYFCKEKNVL